MDDDVDDDSPAARGRSHTPARDEAAVNNKIRLSCNLCPVCWMPLVSDTNYAMDKKWENVSVTFKGKPAFSIKHPSASRSVARHTFAFGINVISHTNRNYQKCHYVHHSMFGNSDDDNCYWTKQCQS